MFLATLFLESSHLRRYFYKMSVCVGLGDYLYGTPGRNMYHQFRQIRKKTLTKLVEYRYIGSILKINLFWEKFPKHRCL